MFGAIAAGLGAVGSLISGFFGFKGKQADIINTGIQLASHVNHADSSEQAAKSRVIVTEAASPYWLAAVWRPMLMVFFASLIGARWFGYMPPHMTEAELLEVYGLLKLGIGGYIGGRTLEKIVNSLGLGSALKQFIAKKLA